ncbi:MAG: response regulator transcription factor [Flavobacteriales bacterium]|nr:response regulator transcription factor [Flavobacteriales bacterium]
MIGRWVDRHFPPARFKMLRPEATRTPVFVVRGERLIHVLYLAPRIAARGMIKAVAIDDDPANRDYLRTVLAEIAPDVAIIGEAGNIHDGMTAIATHAPDLVFLDVEMPGGSGFDMLQKLGTWPFEVIFTTGFQRYAIQAIRFSALDYLLKPVQPDELTEALDRFRKRHPREDRRTVQQQFLANIGQRDEQAMKLTLTTGDRTYFVTPAEVTHCTADDNYTELHTADGRRFVSARTLKDYEDMLAPLGFLRVHRSTLVNKAQITHLDDGHVVLKNKLRVEISRRKKDDVLKALAG